MYSIMAVPIYIPTNSAGGFPEKSDFKKVGRTSVVVQWLGVCLPMQGTRVQALVWEDPTCCIATKPVHHNY